MTTDPNLNMTSYFQGDSAGQGQMFDNSDGPVDVDFDPDLYHYYAAGQSDPLISTFNGNFNNTLSTWNRYPRINSTTLNSTSTFNLGK